MDQCGILILGYPAFPAFKIFKALKSLPFRCSRSFWEGFSYLGQSVLRPSRHTGEDWRALVKGGLEKALQPCVLRLQHSFEFLSV